MPIADGLKAVNDVITAPNWDMGRLINKASERANQELTPPPGFFPGIFFGLPECGTFYGAPAHGMSNELIAWFLGILLAEYTAGILGDKVKDGHCNAHRLPPTYQACPDMQREHMKMLEAFRDRVKQLLADVEGAVSQARQQLPPAKPVPTQASGS
jgi:hypothetical protein